MLDRTRVYSRIAAPQLDKIEVRFSAENPANQHLPDGALILEATIAGVRKTRLVRTYYDTPEQHFRKAGLSIWLCQQDDGIVQTVKSRPTKELPNLTRFEVETVIEETREFPRRIGTSFSAAADGLISEQSSALQQYLRIDTAREKRNLLWQGTRLGYHFDLGQVTVWPAAGPTQQRHVVEIVFEFQDGDPVKFFRFVKQAAKTSSLQLTCLTTPQLGMQLLRGDALASAKATRYTLPVDATAEDVLRQALRSTFVQIVSNIEPALAGQVDGVRQMRVGLRRLRAIERLFRKSLRSDLLRTIVSKAKEFGKTLGVARDWDVFTETTLPQIMQATTLEENDRGVIKALLKASAHKRQTAKNNVTTLIRSPDFLDFCLDLSAYLALSAWSLTAKPNLRRPARGYAVNALNQSLEKVMGLGTDLADAPADARHPLRIELKKMRYALHAFRPLYDKERRKPYLSALSRLQDEFGLLNDAVVAREMTLAAAAPAGSAGRQHDIQCALGASFVIGWSAHRLQQQSEAVHEAWQTFAAMEPFWRD